MIRRVKQAPKSATGTLHRKIEIPTWSEKPYVLRNVSDFYIVDFYAVRLLLTALVFLLASCYCHRFGLSNLLIAKYNRLV